MTQHFFQPLDMRYSFASAAAALADGLPEGHYYVFGCVLRDEVVPHYGRAEDEVALRVLSELGYETVGIDDTVCQRKIDADGRDPAVHHQEVGAL